MAVVAGRGRSSGGQWEGDVGVIVAVLVIDLHACTHTLGLWAYDCLSVNRSNHASFVAGVCHWQMRSLNSLLKQSGARVVVACHGMPPRWADGWVPNTRTAQHYAGWRWRGHYCHTTSRLQSRALTLALASVQRGFI